MESIILTTPSGFKVTFKPYVSFGDKRQIQRVFMAKAKIDPANPKNIDFDASSLYDAQDLALKLLVTSVEGENGSEPFALSESGAILAAIQGWPEADGQAVYDKLDELTKDSTTPEKKGA